MSASADAPGKPRRRRRWHWLLALLALLLAAAFGVNHLLQPEKLGELLLGQLKQRTGLHISTREPAQVGWYPELHIKLRGLDARKLGDDAPLLEAEALDLSLPLSLLIDAIRGNEPQPRITGLTLRSPRLDLLRLQSWLGPSEGPPAPFILPQIDSTLAIENGQLIGDGWRMGGLDIELSGLRDGDPTSLSGALAFSALPRADGDEALPLSFAISATPALHDSDLLLDRLQLELRSDTDVVAGSGTLRLSPGGALRILLDLQLQRWPSLLPALPLPPENRRFTARLDFNGQSDASGQLAVSVQSDVDRIEGELSLGDWPGWLGTDAGAGWLLPPVNGSLRATRLQLGDSVFSDAVIDFDDGNAASPQSGDSSR